eukprot:COSAG02_NODE_32311_length_518_cov_1.081146_1_plen_74_part_10
MVLTGPWLIGVEHVLPEPNLWARDTGDSPKGGEVLRGIAYDPLKHPPLLVPTTVSGGENITWSDFVWATEQARD